MVTEVRLVKRYQKDNDALNNQHNKRRQMPSFIFIAYCYYVTTLRIQKLFMYLNYTFLNKKPLSL